MVYDKRIIAFFDILGFESMIKKLDVIKIKSILSIPKIYFETQSKEKYENIQISIFSDSIIISFIYTEEQAVYNLFLDFMNIIIKFIESGVVCRGFITKGEAIHIENEIFCHGFIDAIKKEKIMNYPRVGFTEEIYQIGT